MESWIGDIGTFLSDGRVLAVYWGLAIFGSFFFALTCLMALFGFGGLDGPDFDTDGAALDHLDTGALDFKLFSIRSILAFLTVFGWGGVIWGRYGLGGFLGAFAAGFATMVVTALMIWGMLKLQYSGTFSNKSFIGKNGSVYLGIPGGREKVGKITVSLNGATHELKAVAEDAIPTGSTVTIVALLDDSRFLVRKIS